MSECLKNKSHERCQQLSMQGISPCCYSWLNLREHFISGFPLRTALFGFVAGFPTKLFELRFLAGIPFQSVPKNLLQRLFMFFSPRFNQVQFKPVFPFQSVPLNKLCKLFRTLYLSSQKFVLNSKSHFRVSSNELERGFPESRTPTA